MAQTLVLVKAGSPLGFWYKLFASGDNDPDIFEGRLKQCFETYCPISPTIITRFDCNNSVEALNIFKRKFEDWNADQNIHRGGREVELIANGWFDLRIPNIRMFMRQAINESE